MDAVGGDHEVVLAVRSVAELDGDDAVALYELLHTEPEANQNVTRRLKQQLVERVPAKREAWADTCPELGDVDLAERSAAVVAEPLARDLDGPGGELRLDAKRPQGASGVAGQIDAGAGRPPHGFALDHLGRETDAHECPRGRQAGDPATDDQDSPPADHVTARRALENERPTDVGELQPLGSRPD